jgi:hypothetical protein
VAEGARLESGCASKRRTEGSNPSLSGKVNGHSGPSATLPCKTPPGPEGSNGNKRMRVQGAAAVTIIKMVSNT